MRKTIGSAGVLLVIISSAVGCHSGGGGGVTVEQTQAALKVDYLGGSDVVGFQIAAAPVPCAVGETATGAATTAFVNLQDNLLSGGASSAMTGLSTTSGHVFASVFLTLTPGCYNVTASPASAIDPVAQTFTASVDCAVATAAGVDVKPGQTTDVSLISQCSGVGNGGTNVNVALNHAPTVVVKIPDTVGFQCQLLQVCADVADVDNDPMQVTFAETDALAPAASLTAGSLTSLGTSGGINRFSECANIAFPDFTTRTFQVTVYDLLQNGMTIESILPAGQTSHGSLTFSLQNQPGFGPQCVDSGGNIVPIESDFSIMRAPGCTFETADQFYCSAADAALAGFTLASTCPNGTFSPTAAFPTCGAVGSGTAPDSDGDGVPDALDACPGTPPGSAVNSAGCALSQTVAKVNPVFPPYGLTFAESGSSGRVGGLTWNYSGIDFSSGGGKFAIYWVANDDPAFGPYGISLNGPVTASAAVALSAADSNLAGGVAVLEGTTTIQLLDGTTPTLQTRLVLTAVDKSSNPLPWQTTAALGITADLGTVALQIPDVASSGFTVNAQAQVWNGSAWEAYLDYYDAASRATSGNAFISYGGSFYDR
jgi:hypothetical protein